MDVNQHDKKRDFLRQTANQIKHRYLYSSKDDILDYVESLQSLFEYLRDSDKTVNSMLREVARYIYRGLEIREVALGLWNENNRTFSYEIMIGFPKNVETSFMNTSYSYDEFIDFSRYGYEISKFTEIHFAEEQEYTEKELSLYSRPSRIGKGRSSMEDIIEGDYFDVFIYGKENKLLGWIEFSSLKNGKMPSIRTIKCIELIASVIASVLESRELGKSGFHHQLSD